MGQNVPFCEKKELLRDCAIEKESIIFKKNTNVHFQAFSIIVAIIIYRWCLDTLSYQWRTEQYLICFMNSWVKHRNILTPLLDILLVSWQLHAYWTDVLYVGILLPFTCRLNCVNMQHNIMFDMQHELPLRSVLSSRMLTELHVTCMST